MHFWFTLQDFSKYLPMPQVHAPLLEVKVCVVTWGKNLSKSTEKPNPGMHKLITLKIPSSVINTSSSFRQCFLRSAASSRNRKFCSGYSHTLHFNISPTSCSDFHFSPKVCCPGQVFNALTQKTAEQNFTCEGTTTVPHFNMSSEYHFSSMLPGNDVTKALYPSHWDCFYPKPFWD